jgi:hypothetical protein
MNARKLKTVERAARAAFEAAACEWSEYPCDDTDKAAAAAYSIWLKAEQAWLDAQARERKERKAKRPPLAAPYDETAHYRCD